MVGHLTASTSQLPWSIAHKSLVGTSLLHGVAARHRRQEGVATVAALEDLAPNLRRDGRVAVGAQQRLEPILLLCCQLHARGTTERERHAVSMGQATRG
eukprot:7091132-Prymnesium_polylepis.1